MIAQRHIEVLCSSRRPCEMCGTELPTPRVIVYLDRRIHPGAYCQVCFLQRVKVHAEILGSEEGKDALLDEYQGTLKDLFPELYREACRETL